GSRASTAARGGCRAASKCQSTVRWRAGGRRPPRASPGRACRPLVRRTTVPSRKGGRARSAGRTSRPRQRAIASAGAPSGGMLPFGQVGQVGRAGQVGRPDLPDPPDLPDLPDLSDLSDLPDLMKPLIIAIDGPSGAGKGTVARAVAGKLGYRHVDSGAMYRAVGWAALRRGIPLDDEEAIAALAAASSL